MIDVSQVIAYLNVWIELTLIFGTYYCTKLLIIDTLCKILFLSGCIISLAIIRTRRQLQWIIKFRIINRETQIRNQVFNPAAA